MAGPDIHTPDLPSPMKNARSFTVGACLLAAVVISLAFSWYYLPFVSDDALISYRYSDRLLHGHGLTWTDGEFVEGYSNLLWVLLVAAGGLIQPNLVFVGWELGLLANVATLIAVVWTFRPSSANSILPVACGLLTLSLSASFAIWGVGGLETALFTALVAWALGTVYRARPEGRDWMYPAVLLGLLSITRPDGILFGISIPLASILRSGYSRAAVRHVLRLMLVPMAFVLTQIGFRLVYYGSFVPNTAYVKVAFTMDRVLNGGVYVGWGALINSVPVTIVVITMALLYRARGWLVIHEALAFLFPALVWSLYLTAVGGDIWPEVRHWLPILVCFAFALISLLAAILPATLPRRATVALIAAPLLHFALTIATLNIYPIFGGGRFQVITTPMILSLTEHELNCIPVGQLLRRAFSARRPLLAVDMAGCLPFETGFPSLDMLGLNDFHIAHHRPTDMGRGTIGHELGDGRYVLSRKPDAIELGENNGEPQPHFRGDFEMVGTKEFKHSYRLVYFGVGTSVWNLWVRVEEGRLGISRSHDEVYIPGFLLASKPGTRAGLDKSGTLVTVLENGDAVIRDVDLPPGTWDVSLMTDALSHLQLETLPTSGDEELRPGTLRIVSDGSARSFRVSGGRGMIYSIEARRAVALSNN